MFRHSDKVVAARQILTRSAICCIFVSIVLTFAYVSYDSRVSSWRLGEQGLRNVAELAEQTIAREIEFYDISLEGVIRSVRDPAVMRLDPALRTRIMFDRSASAKGLGFMTVMDRDGDIIFDSKGAQPRVGNLSDRDFFAVHKKSDNVGLFVSLPFLNRFNNLAPTLALSRRISDADGSFLGVVSGPIRIDYLEGILHRATLGSGGIVTLRRGDGKVLAKTDVLPKDAELHWVSASVADLVSRAPAGVFRRQTEDGIDRLYAYKHISGTSLVIIVGTPVAEILGSWMLRTTVLGFIISIMALAIILLIVTLSHELARRAAAERTARILANTDALTGIANRRALDDFLPQEVRRATRDRHFVSLIMIDVDHFKSYNDNFGHQKGDGALRIIATTLQAAIRQDRDIVARYGGEEFAIVLTHEDPNGSVILARRLMTAIEGLALRHPGSAMGHITVSCGIATGRPSDRTLSAASLLSEADDALYRAKSTGRNRICGPAIDTPALAA
jgi:diguanylate cyclase (GGDEF)-like protein